MNQLLAKRKSHRKQRVYLCRRLCTHFKATATPIIMKSSYQTNFVLPEREEIASTTPVPPVRKHRKIPSLPEILKKPAKVTGNNEDKLRNRILEAKIFIDLQQTSEENIDIDVDKLNICLQEASKFPELKLTLQEYFDAIDIRNVTESVKISTEHHLEAYYCGISQKIVDILSKVCQNFQSGKIDRSLGSAMDQKHLLDDFTDKLLLELNAQKPTQLKQLLDDLAQEFIEKIDELCKPAAKSNEKQTQVPKRIQLLQEKIKQTYSPMTRNPK